MNKEIVMTPEFELLVRSCGLARNLPISGAKIQTHLSGGFDETLFVDMAIQHKVSATAFAGLKKLGIVLGPENSFKLKRQAMQNRLVRGIIVDEASAIVEAAAKHGIPALVLKGPASSIELYGDAFTREYDDLDILVNLPAVDAALPFMAALGWEPDEYPAMKNTDLQNSKLLMRGHHVTFWKKGCPFRVELHDRSGWERELFKRDDIDAVFARSVRLEQDGKAFFAPAPADHVALIIAHGTQHAWCLLHWLLDAAAIIAITNIEQQRSIAARIRSLDMQCQLKLACGLVNKFYPIELPPAFESAIFCRAELEKSIAFAFDLLQPGTGGRNTFKNIINFQLIYAFPLIRTTREKFSSVFKLFQVPQQDAEAIPLPRPLLFLHLFLRPFFVLSRRIKRYRERKTGLHV